MTDEQLFQADTDLSAGLRENGFGYLVERIIRVARRWKEEGADEPHFAWVLEAAPREPVTAFGQVAVVWMLVTGWHDFTGWDCHSGIEVIGEYGTELEAIQAAGDDPRREWGF